METKPQLINKLREIGIDTDNCYPKKTFIFGSKLVVGVYENEFESDCYFAGDYGKKIYKIPKTTTFKADYELDNFKGKDKWLVPVDKCEVIWEDKPYVAIEDVQFNLMTLRDYACIHLKVPNSEKEWLNKLIKEGQTIGQNVDARVQIYP